MMGKPRPGSRTNMPRFFAIIAQDHIRADARQSEENGNSRGVEHDRFASVLAIREE
jgi:hypothetical protein